MQTQSEQTRLAKTRPGMLAAHCYPRAGLSDLCLLADWMTWLFILDDHNDEGVYGRDPESLEQALGTVFFTLGSIGSGAAENPLGAALADLVGRSGERMPNSWRHRFLHHVIDYFTAYVWQAAQRREGKVSDLDTFPQMRRDAGAIMPSFDLIEFVESTMLPPSLYYNRIYQRLLIASANVVCWTNDLMTFEKEMALGDEQNLVAVVREAKHLSLDEARGDVATRTGREIERFLAAEAELPHVFATLQVSDELAEKTLACVVTLRAWMRGHVDWGRTTARYLQYGDEPAPLTGTVDLLDDTASSAPGRGIS